jgi:HEAT repeat protein
MFRSLVPNADRRRLIVSEAQDVTLGGDVAEQWGELARNLDAYSDRRFVSDEYGDELHALQDGEDPRRFVADDPPERVVTWVRSISDESVRDLDLQLLADLARTESEPARMKKVLEILQANVVEAVGEQDWDAAARTIEAIQHVAQESGAPGISLLATEALQKVGASPASEKALAELTGADCPHAATLVRILGPLGPALMPMIAQQWAAARQAAVRARLEQVAGASGKPGREALRRLLSSDSEAPEVRVAAIRLLELTPGTEHLPALESAMSDEHEEVRAEAFRALAGSASDRACDILARGIARADAATQSRLLEQLTGLGGSRARPVLQRLVAQIDPQTAALSACLSLVGALAHMGDETAEPLLASIVRRTRWSTPLRTWRLRSAAGAALRAARSRPVATTAVTAAAGKGGRR